MVDIFFRFLILINIWAPYVGSWFPKIAGAPAGAAIRDILNLILLIYGLSLVFFTGRRFNKFYVWSLLIWLFLCVWVLVLMMHSPNMMQAIMGARSYILFPSIYFIVLINVYYKNINIERVTNFILLNGVIAAFIAIIDVLSSGQLKLAIGYKSDYAGDNFSLIDSYDGLLRATGGFSDALNFGYMLSVVYLLSLHKFYKTDRWIYFLSAIVLAICTIMTLTRGAIVCVLLISTVYIFKGKNSIFRLIIIATMVCFLLIYSYDYWSLYVDLMIERFTDSSSTSKGSTMGRVSMAIAAIDTLTSQPMGLGLGTQGSGNIISSNNLRVNTDNYFFWMALETGVIGMCINVIFFVFVFLSAYSGGKKYQGHLFSKEFFFLMVFIFFFSSLVSSAPSSSTLSIVFWMALALVSTENNSKSNRGKLNETLC